MDDPLQQLEHEAQGEAKPAPGIPRATLERQLATVDSLQAAAQTAAANGDAEKAALFSNALNESLEGLRQVVEEPEERLSPDAIQALVPAIEEFVERAVGEKIAALPDPPICET